VAYRAVEVGNKGDRDGTETVEAYLVPPRNSGAPLRMLVEFQKVRLRRDDHKTVQMTIDLRELSLVSPQGTRTIQPGHYEIYIGGGQPGHSTGLTLPFRIVGSAAVAP
jgi:beta-glucosidase